MKSPTFLTLVALSSVLIIMSFALPTMSQTEEDAKITNVQYTPRIRSGTTDTWTFTIYNANCSENNLSAARFFFEVELDGQVYFDEYNSSSYKTWPCNKGQTISHNYQTDVWSVTRPERRDVTIRLYWFSNGVAHLEDAASFSIAITVLVPLQHIFVIGYLAVYLIACFVLLTYDHVAGLEE